jgi:hypothetical protein
MTVDKWGNSQIEIKLVGELKSFPECQEVLCPNKGECANHCTAGEFRLDDGFTPKMKKDGEIYFCSKQMTDIHGSLILNNDGNLVLCDSVSDD